MNPEMLRCELLGALEIHTLRSVREVQKKLTPKLRRLSEDDVARELLLLRKEGFVHACTEGRQVSLTLVVCLMPRYLRFWLSNLGLEARTITLGIAGIVRNIRI